MATIYDLTSVDEVVSGDFIPVYSTKNGEARKCSLDNLVESISAKLATGDGKVTVYNAPTAGSTLELDDNSDSYWVILTPAGTIASMTLSLPAATAAIHDQEILVNTTQTITTLAHSGGTTVGAPTTLSAGGFYRLRFDGVLKTWYRV